MIWKRKHNLILTFT